MMLRLDCACIAGSPGIKVVEVIKHNNGRLAITGSFCSILWFFRTI